jgi:hypothetical protein
MSEDEAGTLASLNELLSRIVNPAVDGHGGRIVKTMGDGVLAEFVSAVEAVSAAVVIQQAMGDPAIPELLGKPFALRSPAAFSFRTAFVTRSSENLRSDSWMSVRGTSRTSRTPSGPIGSVSKQHRIESLQNHARSMDRNRISEKVRSC